MADRPVGALLVGSVPLQDSDAVFRAAADVLGDRLRRVPDGETGDRTNWIGWQAGVMATTPTLESATTPDDAYTALALFRIRPGVAPGEIAFGNLGYADAAQSSYQTFATLKADGVIPDRVRFQVSLPTPLAPVAAFVVPDDQAAVEPAYERQLMAELDQILATIPHDQLAVQWDVAVEFGILEGVFPSYLTGDTQEKIPGILDRLVRYCGRVPDAVELGIHLCYGDAGHQHFKEPDDTSLLVEVANALAARVARPIQWIHMPVPRDRDDDAYFAPLDYLALHPETELYLGLIHMTGGVEAASRRIAAAGRHAASFGVATECGFGRRPAETVRDLMQIHADVTAPLDGAG